MTITVHPVGRFREVIFRDAEHDDVRAHSGLLDDDEARMLSQRLREVADTLLESHTADDQQTVLPFYLPERLTSFGQEQERDWAGERVAAGY